MAPTQLLSLTHEYDQILKKRTGPAVPPHDDWRERAKPIDLILESWSQGLIVGSLLIMAFITIANMRRKSLLHKLILAELLLAMSHGTFAFGGTNWYLSATATLLYTSWIIHNIVSFLKVRPFLSTPGGFFAPTFSIWTKRIYISTLILVTPVIAFQISDNFRFFNNLGGWYRDVRPYEPLIRDPWWIFCCLLLFRVIQRCYGTGTIQLVRQSPRFGILLSSIVVSLIFTIVDVVASLDRALYKSSVGINPWWKLSLVFKCLTDTIMLDDFKTELKKLGIKRIAKAEKKRNSIALVLDVDPACLSDTDSDNHGSRDSSRQARQNSTWYRGRRGTSASLSPTTTKRAHPQTEKHSRPEPCNDPNARMEELEFSTALALDPSRVSGVESVAEGKSVTTRTTSGILPQQSRLSSHRSQKEEVHGHTSRISRLPRMKEWRFEAIKPGRTATSRDEEQIDPVDNSHKNVETGSRRRAGGEQSPDMHGNTLSQTSNSDHVRQDHGNFATHDERRADVETSSSDSSSVSSAEKRERRFKMSIGAAEYRF